jgi:hypothetical protein
MVTAPTLNLAEDFEGNKYEIVGVWHAAGYDCIHGKPEQDIIVTNGFRKGTLWLPPTELLLPNVMYSFDFTFRLINISCPEKKKIRLIFKSESFPAPKDDELAKEKIKALLQELNLRDDSMRKLVKDMLSVLFTHKQLHKLLKSDRLEFIKDRIWIYIKAGGIAYRT